MVRDSRFDFYKGFLMLGVVWGHTITALLSNAPNHNNIHCLFRIYDMPLFMLISGYFLSLSVNKYDFKSLLLNKITTILFPTILWSLICSRFTSVSEYYFLWAVFFSSCFCVLVNKLISSSLLRLLILLIIIICLHLQPYSIWNIPFLFPYFVLGYYGKLIHCKSNKYYIYIMALFILGFSFWNSSYSVWKTGSYIFSGNNIGVIILYRTIMAILGIVVILRLMDILFNTISKEQTWFYKLIINTGKETLAIYILQAILIENFLKRGCGFLYSKLGVNIFNLNENVLGYFYAPIFSMITLYILLLLISYLKKNQYFKFLFGFKLYL